MPLGSALEALIDHRGKTPKKLGGDWSATGHRVVSALNIKNSTVDDNEHHYISDDLYANWMKIKLQAGDVILTSEAPTGEVAYLAHDCDWALGQRVFGLRGKKDVLDGRFLYYALRGGDLRHDLMSRTTGTTVQGIRQAELVKVEINLPPFPEQRAIAATLGALDDKIESNRKALNVIQDASAAIFSRWRSAQSDVEGTTFGAYADVYGGSTPKTKVAEYWDGDNAWATPTDVTGLAAPYLFETSRSITDAGLRSCTAMMHPVGTIFMTSRATIGAFALNQVPAATNQGFIAVRPKQDRDRYFLFEEMRSRVEEFRDNANGSTFLEISRGRFKELPLAVPRPEALTQLDQELRPLHLKAVQLAIESNRLSTLRDTLLPELLSGRLETPVAES